MKYYAGIGARKTPIDIQSIMRNTASKLENIGYVLRSGGATGADSAFESGIINPSLKEIFYANDATKSAIELASKFHQVGESHEPLKNCKHYWNKLDLLVKLLEKHLIFI